MNILQDWVGERLGLRHQGVILSAIRGPDNIDRDDKIKDLVRMYRSLILRPHCGDINKSSSFMFLFDKNIFDSCSDKLVKSLDHYNLHYFLHFLHAIEILGYYHPDYAIYWRNLYWRLCKKMHITPETVIELDIRLNKNEVDFAKDQ